MHLTDLWPRCDLVSNFQKWNPPLRSLIYPKKHFLAWMPRINKKKKTKNKTTKKQTNKKKQPSKCVTEHHTKYARLTMNNAFTVNFIIFKCDCPYLRITYMYMPLIFLVCGMNISRAWCSAHTIANMEWHHNSVAIATDGVSLSWYSCGSLWYCINLKILVVMVTVLYRHSILFFFFLHNTMLLRFSSYLPVKDKD